MEIPSEIQATFAAIPAPAVTPSIAPAPRQDAIVIDIDVEKQLFTRQVELEQLFNKNQLLDRISREFTECRQFDFVAYLEQEEIPVRFGISLLVQMALHKRTTVSTLVGLLRNHIGGDAQETADLLVRCVNAQLVTWDPALQQFIVIFTIAEETQEEIDRYQFPLPMVVPPRPIRDNMSTGYLLGRQSSVILNGHHHENDVCLDHLNRVNAIRFSLDMQTAAMIKNQWRNLDRRKDGESTADFQSRKRAFEKYDRVAKDVISQLTEFGNVHYMTHQYDKRGRTYCAGYHVNYQGTAWNKAVIQLADKELVE